MSKAKAQTPINYSEALAAEAAAISKRISGPSGDRIRFNGHTIITPEGEGSEIEVVILDFVSNNMYYDQPFDRDNPKPPACFAIGQEPGSMAPSDNSPDKQNDTCQGCPMNEFGSALVGKGKACKNTRQVAVAPASALDNPDAEVPIWVLSVSPMAIKTFDTYVSKIASKHKKIPIGVITSIKLDAEITYPAPVFSVIRELDDEELGVFYPVREAALERLFVEPDTSTYEPPKRRR